MAGGNSIQWPGRITLCGCVGVLLTCIQNAVRSGTKRYPLAMSTATMVTGVCSKCGFVKTSGKRSCCARGGAWFKNCGDSKNIKFDHTWAQGIQACKRKFSG